MYENGYGVLKNYDTSLHYYQQAEEQGNEKAIKKMESLQE